MDRCDVSASGIADVLIFLFIPAIQSFYYSLTEWNGFKAEKVFIGLDNFISLLHDKTFLQALGNTMLFLLLGVC